MNPYRLHCLRLNGLLMFDSLTANPDMNRIANMSRDLRPKLIKRFSALFFTILGAFHDWRKCLIESRRRAKILECLGVGNLGQPFLNRLPDGRWNVSQ